MPELTPEQRAERKERLMLKSAGVRIADFIVAMCDEIAVEQGITRQEAFDGLRFDDINDISDLDDEPKYDLGHSYKD